MRTTTTIITTTGVPKRRPAEKGNQLILNYSEKNFCHLFFFFYSPNFLVGWPTEILPALALLVVFVVVENPHWFYMWCVFLFSISIHELAHALAARLVSVSYSSVHLGVGPTVVSFGNYYIGAIPLFGYVAVNEDEMARASLWRTVFIDFAGPLANFGAFALITVPIIGFNGVLNRYFYSIYTHFFATLLPFASTAPVAVSHTELHPLFLLLEVNLSAAAFNILPFYPLDGSKVFSRLIDLYVPARWRVSVGGVYRMFGVALNTISSFYVLAAILTALYRLLINTLF